MNQLIGYCQKHIINQVVTLPQALNNLPPNHPSIINNIYHPLNPSNPQNLQLNPGINLLFQQDLNIEASIGVKMKKK
ncbi:hypothetical protein [Coxiella endosymbiont of Ornithodoros maritimus]|uniref:hypothetical protein n=1 Tax=Coxiella endosymbiont of Ornithodoros maritimus TaxID=1656172 RepID=UPI0022644D77|nr:hypothetical protein [Coxiella endosymbiont of Ornithodoros maritimus]